MVDVIVPTRSVNEGGRRRAERGSVIGRSQFALCAKARDAAKFDSPRSDLRGRNLREGASAPGSGAGVPQVLPWNPDLRYDLWIRT